MSLWTSGWLKNKYTAPLFSFLLPGLGQLYQGRWVASCAWFAAFSAVFSLKGTQSFLPAMALFSALEAIWKESKSPEGPPNRKRIYLYQLVGIPCFIGWSLSAFLLWSPYTSGLTLVGDAEALAHKARKCSEALGRFPQSFEECGTERKDPWGTPYSVVPLETGFEIRSAGPDRSFSTDDDLSYRYRN